MSDLQKDVVINGNFIEGELEYVTDYTGFSSDPDLQEGNYLALHWGDPPEGATSLKVGLVPSAIGMDLQECIDDTDRNGVFRVTNPSTQKFVREITVDGDVHREEYNLNRLTCKSE